DRNQKIDPSPSTNYCDRFCRARTIQRAPKEARANTASGKLTTLKLLFYVEHRTTTNSSPGKVFSATVRYTFPNERACPTNKQKKALFSFYIRCTRKTRSCSTAGCVPVCDMVI
ncbi:AGAP009269-PA, partial [Anopheles gambiae str. PEST]